MKSVVFYGIGHSMVDYYATKVDDSLFSEIYPKSPLHISNTEFQNILQKVKPVFSCSGGTTVNCLKTLATLGNKCFFSGTTGTEPNGNRDADALFFQKELARSKIEAQLFSNEDRTGQFLTAYNQNGQKVVVASVGAANKIQVAQLNEIRFAHSNCFVLEGMQFANELLLERIIDLSLHYNVPLAIDCATEQSASLVANKLCDLGQFIDVYLFANKNESAIIKSIIPTPQEYCKVFVEKQDACGSVAYFEDKICSSLSTKPSSTLKDYPFYDDTGAGDTFTGAFLHSIFSNENTEDLTLEYVQNALVFASDRAAKVLSRFGV